MKHQVPYPQTGALPMSVSLVLFQKGELNWGHL